jgi:hypothetical protein
LTDGRTRLFRHRRTRGAGGAYEEEQCEGSFHD